MRHERKREFVRRIKTAKGKLAIRETNCSPGLELVIHCPIYGHHGIPTPDCSACEFHVAHFGPGDDGLHAELTGRKESNVVYCNYMNEAKELDLLALGKARKLQVRSHEVEDWPIITYHKLYKTKTSTSSCISCQHDVGHSGDAVFCGCKIHLD
ncbi:MAG: hypothetical protein OXH90_03615 [Paracoccaceae bacterium]|nr:hypothetical protein [Paracoccaceae bacterium]MDE2916918.1 hypothetical protein [Paracoccaceae bacterium]